MKWKLGEPESVLMYGAYLCKLQGGQHEVLEWLDGKWWRWEDFYVSDDGDETERKYTVFDGVVEEATPMSEVKQIEKDYDYGHFMYPLTDFLYPNGRNTQSGNGGE